MADDDARVRYLRQQIELGGAEVILRSPSAAPGASRALLESVPAAMGAPAPASTPGSLEADLVDGDSKHWLVGAPPIPGSGLSVLSPAPGLVPGGEWTDLAAVAAAVASCRKCPLCEARTQTVPGEGNPHARLMCVGEGPGQTEDELGRPFVGRAGELLDKILGAVELAREEVFIANVVKCRPPQNRKPLPDEQQACLPYLHRQIALVRPKVLLALGGTAAEALLGVKKSLGQLRGVVHRFDNVPLVVTYHPAALLRNPNWKKPTWDDVRIARQLLDA